MNWEQNIFGMVPASEWLNVGTIVARQNDPIDGLLGDLKTDNILAQWQYIADEYQIPIMAQYHAFDTEAKTTPLIPIDTRGVEKGLIKVKRNQSERLRELVRTGVQENQLLDYVLNDGIRLADQVVTRTKVAKNELLATGQVTIQENGLGLTVDYGVPEAHTQFELDLSRTADVPSQLQEIVDSAREVGVVLTGIVTSRKNINKMRKNDLVQYEINGAIGSGALVRRSALEDWLGSEYGLNTVIEQDLTYGADVSLSDGRPVISTARYYPEDKVTFFATNPGGQLGVGLWGNPPEVDAARFFQVETSSVSPYVFVSQWMETDPAVLWTKASGLFMPVLYNPNSLFIATVVAEDDGGGGNEGSGGGNEGGGGNPTP